MKLASLKRGRRDGTLVGLGIFLATLLIVMTRPYRIPEAAAAAVGAVLMVLSGVVGPGEALRVLAGQWNVFGFFLGLMVIAAVAEHAGIFDALARRSVIAETFETACTWGQFADLHAGVTEAAREAVQRVCGQGVVTCRFTHVYPDGPAPYYGIYGGGRWDVLVEQWDDIKAAVSDAVIAHGGTITHHHAVGRDHRRWYDRQRPEPFAAALRAMKTALDPAGIMNPGVLVDDGPNVGRR